MPSPELVYRVTVSDCDVVDKDRLREFRRKLAEWHKMLFGADGHCIWPQIHSMLWDAVLFRTVNNLRRDAEDHLAEGVGFNGPVLRLFDVGFMVTQVTAIRRLTERQWKSPDRRVISLRALIDDIENCRELFTRENYVAYDGGPYDCEAALQRWMQRQLAEPGGSLSGAVSSVGPDAWITSDITHRAFDRLVEGAGRVRRRTDTLTVVPIRRLAARLDECEDVCKFTDKFVAHGADPANRQALTPEQEGVTLERLAKCQRAIYEVAAFVSDTLLGISGVAAVPVPQYDHLEGLDKSWIAKGEMRKALDYWRQNVATVEEWRSSNMWPTAEE